MTPTSIETMTGKFVDLVHPDPATIEIKDIAWATSRMPRYVGHTVSAVPYTIGQHSIFVMHLVQELFKRDGVHDLKRSFYEYLDCKQPDSLIRASIQNLLSVSTPPGELLMELLIHDASEAYIVDIPTPLKESEGFKQVYMELENRMMSAIRTALRLGPANEVYELFVKWADRVALTIEAHHLIQSRGVNWTRLLNLDVTSLQLFVPPWEPIKVYEDYLDWYRELTRAAH